MGAKSKSNWILRYYEMIILAVVLIALLASAIILFVTIDSRKKQLREKRWEKPAKIKTVKDIDPEAIRAASDQFKTTHNVSVESNKYLFVSRIRVCCVNPKCALPIEYDAEVCPFCAVKQPPPIPPNKQDRDNDGMPDIWEVKYEFNPQDDRDKTLDADDDGFINIVEYEFGSNPRDQSSFPPLAVKLRYVNIKRFPLGLKYQSDMQGPENENGEKERIFQINNLNTGKTEFRKIGETTDNDFRLLRFEPEIRNKDTYQIEKPAELIVLSKSGKELIIKKRESSQSYEFYVRFEFLLADEENRAERKFFKQVNDEFELKLPNSDLREKYILNMVEANPIRIAVKRISDGQVMNIQHINEIEQTSTEKPGQDPPPRKVQSRRTQPAKQSVRRTTPVRQPVRQSTISSPVKNVPRGGSRNDRGDRDDRRDDDMKKREEIRRFYESMDEQ